MRYLNLVLLAALALAACEKAETPTVAENTRAGAAGPGPAPATAAPSLAANAIPSAIQGRWGLVPADCTSDQGDAKGLLTIDATTLKFYESRATLGAVKELDDGGIEAAFAFSGEGQTWNLDIDFDVEDGGKTLIRKETGRDAAPRPLKYTRCA